MPILRNIVTLGAGKQIITLGSGYDLVTLGTAPLENRVTQVIAEALMSDGTSAGIRATQVVALALVSLAASTLTQQEFYMRLWNLLPRPWWSTADLQPGGVGYAFLWAIAGAMAQHMSIRTAEGLNLDNISLDYCAGNLPRLNGEQDPAFALRIVEYILNPRITISAMQKAVNAYFTANFGSEVIPRVWDSTSDPSDAHAYNIVPPMFVIEASFPYVPGSGWFLGKAYLNRMSFLLVVNGKAPWLNAPPGLKTLVDSIRAEGTVPVYFITRYTEGHKPTPTPG